MFGQWLTWSFSLQLLSSLHEDPEAVNLAKQKAYVYPSF